MRSPGDFAEEVAQEFLAKHEDVLTEDETLIDQEGPLVVESKHALFKKVDFRWRPSDRRFLETVRASVDATFAKIYAPAFAVIDEFYSAARVQELTEHGVALFDEQGRPVWKKKDGKIVEDWSQITGQDIEQALFHLQRHKISIADQQSQLLQEAILAKHAEDDIRNAAWEAIIDGTNVDKNAKASRVSLNDKYHAFWRYSLYLRSQTFTNEVSNFMRLLERLRGWRLQEARGDSRW